MIAYAQSALTGKWQGKTVNGFEIALDLARSGTTFSGTLFRNGEKGPITDGRVSNSRITFKATLNDREEGFTGDLNGDQMTVWLDRQGPKGAAVLKRLAE
jgi:hypothetical protein